MSIIKAKNTSKKIIIVHNIIAPYKIVLFNELAKVFPNLSVIFIAETEGRRDWDINYSKINFDYTLLFKGAIDDVSLIKMVKKTWSVLNQLNPNSLVICDYSKIFGWISLLWGKVKKIKLVFWLDSTIDDRRHYFPKEQIKHFFLSYFDLFLSPGTKTKDYLQSMGVNKNRIVKIGYAVDNSFYINEVEKINKNNQNTLHTRFKPNKNFLYVGRLSEEKNIFLLLNAYNTISKENNTWDLTLLGDGPQKEIIKQYIIENNLEDRIYLVGFVQQVEIVNYYLNSDVFILPSKSEPWGLVINEALLCGLPVIISNKCGSVPELVKEGFNGFTFDPNNQKELEKLMREFIDGSHNTKIFGQNSKDIVNEHSPQKVAMKIKMSFEKYDII